MKKFVSALILATAVSFTGCGNSIDFSSVDSLPSAVAPVIPAPVVPPADPGDPAPPVVVDGFFVDAAAGSDTTGNFTGGLPFQTIQAAVAAAGTGATITVRPGSYTGEIQMLDNQILQGEAGGVIPETTGPIDLADGNTVDFMRLANSPGSAIIATNQTGGTITNSEIDTTTAGGSGILAFPLAGGDWDISNNSITGVDGGGIFLTLDGGNTATVQINDNQITNSENNAIAFITSESSNLSAQVTGNTMTGNMDGFTFEVIAAGASTSCYDIEGNTNDDTYLISQGITGTGTLEVEQFDTLPAVNNNSGTATVSLGSIAPTSVDDGTCGF